MNILSIETSTQKCSAAVLRGGEIYESAEIAGHRHAEIILPMIDSLLSESGLSLVQIDAIACGRGPGSFSGVRIATAIAQGLAFGAQRPVVPVSSLMALASGAYRTYKPANILACLDARMGQVYWCAYTASAEDQISPRTNEALSFPQEVKTPDNMPWFKAGPGFKSYAGVPSQSTDQTESGQDATLIPCARDIAVLARRFLEQGAAVAAEAVSPVYIRNQVAWAKSEL
ncbi:MAG: tRNA (adenosine(37)-N6)-threonylcarbamoyltransferase complex dimerization subunit type 1 TsaB [Gammaproteobacteria bacterium]|nr:tRNA (adenosine(37)-N6)-threonylcarbamoyltransferase complex dimerization subunit type 1 TsaB [Gammaproteobacteria bacterium]